jgi:putative membrane protein
VNRPAGRALAETMTDMSKPRPLVGLVAGLAAGLAASFAMATFQNRTSKLIEDQGSGGDPSTVKAADKVSEVAIGQEVPEPWRESAGQVVHYVTGAALGALYGLVAEYRPEATKGFGSAFGVMTSLVLDEGAVPAAGLSAGPTRTAPAVHGYGFAAHLVYGVALEGVRAAARRAARRLNSR